MSYYDDHSDEFCAATQHSHPVRERERFLTFLPKRAKILDAGSGSGRDSLAFAQLGHTVVSIDASLAMVTATTRLTGNPAFHLGFDDIDFSQEFDGVWACASLLHVPSGELAGVLRRLHRALKMQGIFYASFKYGTSEAFRNGRWYVDYDEAKFALFALPDFPIVQTWVTADVRSGRGSELWLNLLLRRER